LYLSEMPLVIQLGDTVCVHGGLELKYLDMDVHRINVGVSEWLRGNAERPALIDKEDSPMWNRAFSAPADRPITTSRWVKNGPLECLEILADGTARVLTRTGVVPGAVRRIEENAEPPKTKRANSGAGERGFVQGSTST